MFVDYRKSDVRSQRSEVSSQRSEVRCQMSEVRSQMFDFGFQISDVDRLGESFRCRQKVVIIASENLEKLEIGNPPDQLSLLCKIKVSQQVGN